MLISEARALDPRPITAVILAGGQGTRLRPLTYRTPKPVVPLLNVPFLAYQLDPAPPARRHRRGAVLLLHGGRDAAGSWVTAPPTASRSRYVVETEPLGTAGGVRNAVDLVGGLVVVLNGDILTDVDLSAMLRFHAERGAARHASTCTRVRRPDAVRPGGARRRTAACGASSRSRTPRQRDQRTPSMPGSTCSTRALARADSRRARRSSIEREFFPGLLADAHAVLRLGRPAITGSTSAAPRSTARRSSTCWPAGCPPRLARDPGADRRWIAADVSRSTRARRSRGPCVIGAGTPARRRDAAWARRPCSGERCVVGRGPRSRAPSSGTACRSGAGAVLRDCIVGAGARSAPRARVGPGAVLEAERRRGSRRARLDA